jgi:hypothetical protein
MNKQIAIKTLRDHLSESSTHKWKLIEKAIDILEEQDAIDVEFDKQYYKRLEDFKFQIEGVFNDFHCPL